MHEQYFFTPLMPWTQRTQSLDPRLAHPELGEPVFPERYLGSEPDGLPHTLTLRLDTTGENKTAGAIQLRYCDFDGKECGCRPDLGGGEGIYVGDRLLRWGSDENCIFMSDLETDPRTPISVSRSLCLPPLLLSVLCISRALCLPPPLTRSLVSPYRW
jgi:hypothetical protein